MSSPLPKHTLNYQKKNNMGQNKYGEYEVSVGQTLIFLLVFVVAIIFTVISFEKDNPVSTIVEITYQDNSKEILHYNKALWIKLEEGDLSIDNTIIRSSVKSYKEKEQKLK